MGESPSDHDLLISIGIKLDQALSRQLDHEVRMRTIEEKLQQASGGWKAVVSIGALAGALGAWLVKFLKMP